MEIKMLKKVIPIAVVLCLIFGMSAMAENENIVVEDPAPKVSEQIVQGADKIPQGERGNVGMPPMGEKSSGEITLPEGVTPPEGFAKPQGDFTPPQNSADFTPPQNSGEFTLPQGNENSNTQTIAPKPDIGITEENQQTSENNEEFGQIQGGNSTFGAGMPEGMGGFLGNMQSTQNIVAQQPTGFLGFVKTYSPPITSVVLLGLAFIFVIFYRRKNY